MTLVLLLCVVNRNSNNSKKLLIQYLNVVYIICISSLLFWIIGSNLKIIHPTGSIISSWTGKEGVTIVVPSYFGIYFETQRLFFLRVFKVVRNSAIFTEAPMCSFHFCMALLIDVFVNNRFSLLRRIILTLGVISTFATTGYIVIIIAFTCKYVFSKSKLSLFNAAKILIVPVFLIIGILIANYLITEKMTYGTSGSTRLDDFRAGYSAWMDSPFIGNGFNNDDSIIRYMNKSVRRQGNYGFSNSPMRILAYGGIYLLLPYIIGIIASIRNAYKRGYDGMVFFGLFLFMFTFTLIPFQYISFFIIFSFPQIYKENISNLD